MKKIMLITTLIFFSIIAITAVAVVPVIIFPHVNGTIAGISSNPINGATVEISTSTENCMWVNLADTVTTTDANGEYYLHPELHIYRNPPTCDMTLTISKENYETVVREWTIEVTNPSQYNGPWPFDGTNYTIDESLISLLTAPQYSNIVASPDIYSQNGEYTFSIDWRDNVNIADVKFDAPGGSLYEYSYLNGDITKIGDTYSLILNDLPVGNFVYQWYAINEYDNENATGLITFNIRRATPTAILTITPNGNQIYNTQITATCSINNAEQNAKLYRNGIEVPGENGVAIVLPVQTHNYICNASETANYTTVSETGSKIISKFQTIINLFLNGQPWTADTTEEYGFVGNINATINVPNLQPNVTLKMNNSQVSNPDTRTALGTYFYNASYAGNQNYTSATTSTRMLNIIRDDPFDPSDPQIHLALDGQETNLTISYTQINRWMNVAGWTDFTDGRITLYKDNLAITSSITGSLSYRDPEVFLMKTFVYRLELTGADNHVNGNLTRTLTVFDDVDPVITSCEVITSEDVAYPPIYKPGMTYTFKCNIVDVQAVNVNFTFNGINYTPSKSGNVYSAILTDLGANETGYDYEWHANDMSGNDATYTNSYIINKAPVDVNLTLNGTRRNINFVYGTPLIAVATANIPISVILERNGQDVTFENNTAVVLPAISNVYVARFNGNENYTADSESFTATVSKKIPDMHISLNGIETDGTFAYENITNITTYENNNGDSDLIYTLNENGRDIPSLEETTRLGVGTHLYTFSTVGGENYSTASVIRNVTITKKQILLHIAANNNQSQFLGTYPTEVNITAWKDATINDEGNLSLSENGVLLGSLQKIWTPDVGTYRYIASLNSQNYSALGVLRFVTISKTISNVSLVFDKTSSQQYGTPITATCSVDNTEQTPILYRDGVDVNLTENGQPIILSAMTHNYVCNASTTQHYNTGSITGIFGITKTSPVLHISINDEETDKILTLDDLINVTAWTELGDASAVTVLARNGDDTISNPDYSDLPVGTYNYVYSYLESENYTTDSITRILNITDGNAPQYSNCIVSPNPAVYAPNTLYQFNCTWTDDSGIDEAELTVGTATYDLNSGLSVDGNVYYIVLTDLAAGSYPYNWAVKDISGNTNTSSGTLQIDPAPTSIELFLNSSLWTDDITAGYGFVSDINGTINVTSLQSNVMLNINNAPTTNPEQTTHDFGVYYFNATFAGNQNYTASSTVTKMLNITRADPIDPINSVMHLALNNEENNVEIIYGTESNVTGWITPIDGTLTLYVDDSQIDVSTSGLVQNITTLAPGVYTYTLNLTGATNYNDASITRILNVTDNTLPEITGCGVNPPSGTAYVPGQNYVFTCTVTEDNLDNVTFVFNGVNYQPTRKADWFKDMLNAIPFYPKTLSINTYTITLTDLAANPSGYAYSWEANDTMGNKATYDNTYVINKAVSEVHLSINSVIDQNPMSVATNTPVTIEGIFVTGDSIAYTNLTKNGTQIINPITETFTSQDVYLYKFEYSESQNYTGNSTEVTLEVLDDTAPQYSTCTVSPASGANYAPGAPYDFSCTWTDNIDVDDVEFNFNGTTYRLSSNEISKNGDVYNITLVGLDAGTYSYIWRANDTNNLWNQTASESYLINKATIVDPSDPSNSIIYLTLNDAHSDLTINYGTESNATGWINSTDGTLTLYRNGTDVTTIENNTMVVLSGGVHNYTLALTESTNYNDVLITRFVTVNKMNPINLTNTSDSIMHLELNGVESNLIINSGTQSNATGWMYPIDGTLTLYRNGTNVSLTDVSTLASGVYNYTLSLTGSENYTDSSLTRILTVNKQDIGGPGGPGGSPGGAGEASVKLVIDLTVPSTVSGNSGENMSFTATVKNVGQADVTTITITVNGIDAEIVPTGVERIVAGESTTFKITFTMPENNTKITVRARADGDFTDIGEINLVVKSESVETAAETISQTATGLFSAITDTVSKNSVATGISALIFAGIIYLLYKHFYAKKSKKDKK